MMAVAAVGLLLVFWELEMFQADGVVVTEESYAPKEVTLEEGGK